MSENEDSKPTDIREIIKSREHLRSEVSLNIREIARRNAYLPD